MKIFWCLVLLMLIELFAPFNEISALSCIEPPEPKAAYKEHDLVFRGEVTYQKDDTYQFMVKEWYKGVSREEVTAIDSIGFWLAEKVQKGGEYLVYAKQENNRILISPCSRTKSWSLAKNEVNAFPVQGVVYKAGEKQNEAKGTEGKTSETSSKTKNESGIRWLISGGVLLGTVSLIGAIRFRKKTK